MKSALTVKEVVHELGVSRATVYNLIKAKKLKAHKLGHRTIFKSEDVKSLLNSLPEAA